MTLPSPTQQADQPADVAVDPLVDTSGPGWLDLTDRPGFFAYLASLWQRRRFAVEIARSKLKGEHVDSALGELWFIINPALLVGVYWLVFGAIFKTSRGLDEPHLLLPWLAVGVFTFDVTRTGLLRSSRALTSNRGLMASLFFPRALLPVAVALEQIYSFLPQIGVAALVVLLFGEPLTWNWLFVIPVLVVQTLFTLGAGLIVARLGHHTEDISNALPFAMRIIFYLSGIIFPVSFLTNSDTFHRLATNLGMTADTAVNLMALNPFYSLIELQRHFLMESLPSSVPVSLLWASLCTWTIVLLVVGLTFFRAAELDYASD